MASIERRESDWRVVWRQDGRKQYERFADLATAEWFRGLVEGPTGRNNRWPVGWLPGHGFADAPPSDAPLFRDYAVRSVNARPKATRRTRADYLRDLENHLYPTFGSKPLDQITREDVRLWLVAKADSRTAPKTIKNVHALASSVFTDAIDSGVIPGPNPFKGAMRALPVVKTEEMVFLTHQEVDVIANAVGELYRPLVLFLAHTGLRWSEATALRVTDVEVLSRRKTVTVSKAWKRDDDGTFYIAEPKTRRARRTLPLDRATVDALIPLVASRDPGDFLFVNTRGGYVHQSTFAREHWQPTVRKLTEGSPAVLGKRPRIHDLRHTHASWLIADGVPLTAVQRRLGHESIQTTSDRYGHLDAHMDDRVLAALDRLGPAVEPAPVDA